MNNAHRITMKWLALVLTSFLAGCASYPSIPAATFCPVGTIERMSTDGRAYCAKVGGLPTRGTRPRPRS